MRDHGTCEKTVYAKVLQVRSRLRGDTQRVEGANKTVQRITSTAHRIKTGLTNARMSIKHGTPPTVQECSDMHDAIVAEVKENASVPT